MGEVIDLLQPLDERRITDAVREITNAETRIVIVIAASPDAVGVRSFGPRDHVIKALSEVLDAI